MGSLYKDTDPIMGASPSQPHHLLEDPPPDTITLGVRCQHTESGDPHIQTITPTSGKSVGESSQTESHERKPIQCQGTSKELPQEESGLGDRQREQWAWPLQRPLGLCSVPSDRAASERERERERGENVRIHFLGGARQAGSTWYQFPT